MTVERRRLVQAYGAKIVLTPGVKGMKGAIAGAKKVMAEIPGSFQPSQFDNPSNPEVHSRTTAEEIMADTGAAAWTRSWQVWARAARLRGLARVIRERIGKGVLIVAVEPKDSPVLSGGQPGPHKIQGIGAGFIPDNYDGSVVDRIVQVSYEDSVETARRLGKEEAILSGISTGAILHTALGVARELGSGKRVVAIVCDTRGAVPIYAIVRSTKNQRSWRWSEHSKDSGRARPATGFGKRKDGRIGEAENRRKIKHPHPHRPGSPDTP